MIVINYDKELERLMQKLKKQGERPKLLLHSCCAPCSSACIERLKDAFDLTVFYYNPNLDSLKEYDQRSAEQIRLCKEWGIKYVICDYNQKDFLSRIVGHEHDVEGGARCSICFKLRLRKTCEYALQNGFDYFATTLTVSPLKDAKVLNSIGIETGKSIGVNYLPTDFKKRSGYYRSVELSKMYNLYRQSYCGCTFSKNKIVEDYLNGFKY